MFCTSCGSVLFEDQKFCGSCGQAVKATGPPPVAPPEPRPQTWPEVPPPTPMQQSPMTPPPLAQAYGTPPRSRMHKAVYFSLMLGGFLLGGLLTLWGATDRKVDELLLFSWMPFIPAIVALYVMVYKMWAAIQDGYARTSPGKAVGFMFIPLFNLYWIWQVFYGWAQDYNAYIKRRQLSVRPVSEGMFMVYVISCYVCAPVAVVMLFIIINAVCNAVNALEGA